MVRYRTEYTQRKAQARSPGQGGKPRQSSRRIRPALIRLVQRYPLGLLLIAWMVAIVIAAIAATEMVTVDSSELPAPTSQASPAPAQTAPLTPVSLPSPPSIAPATEESQSLPFLTWAVVALGCAIGCTLISRQLKPRQPTRRMEFSSSSRRSARHSPTSSGRPSNSEESASSANQTAHPATPVSVTVLPHDQSHPLDWDEPSLADSLDLRQRRPLSYWLRS